MKNSFSKGEVTKQITQKRKILGGILLLLWILCTGMGARYLTFSNVTRSEQIPATKAAASFLGAVNPDNLFWVGLIYFVIGIVFGIAGIYFFLFYRRKKDA
jgi:hypothetical protein